MSTLKIFEILKAILSLIPKCFSLYLFQNNHSYWCKSCSIILSKYTRPCGLLQVATHLVQFNMLSARHASVVTRNPAVALASGAACPAEKHARPPLDVPLLSERCSERETARCAEMSRDTKHRSVCSTLSCRGRRGNSGHSNYFLFSTAQLEISECDGGETRERSAGCRLNSFEL